MVSSPTSHFRAAIAAAALVVAGCAIRPAPPVVAPPPKVESAARYDRSRFDALPATSDEDWIAAWPAFLQSCKSLGRRDAGREVCAQTLAVDGRSASAIRSFFGAHFDVYRIVERRLQDGKEAEIRSAGLVTGYYEPLLRGSRERSQTYPVPLYRVPDDLLVIELAGVHPELAGMRLRGRLQGQRVVPYPSRGEITNGNPLAGSELLWVDDPIEAFFLQIQATVEKVFVNFNPQSTLLLGQARGAAICAAVSEGLAVHEYAALRIKQAVVGFGQADKRQVQSMVQRLLALDGVPAADAADALACAICHAHSRTLLAAGARGGARTVVRSARGGGARRAWTARLAGSR